LKTVKHCVNQGRKIRKTTHTAVKNAKLTFVLKEDECY